MSKREQRNCGIGLVCIGALILIILPEAATAGILLGVWGICAIFSKTKTHK